MSYIIYNDHAPKSAKRATSYHNQEATLYYLKHFHNECVLAHMSRTERDFFKRKQIEKEIAIAQRKMRHWERHENFDHNLALRLTKRVRAEALRNAKIAA